MTATSTTLASTATSARCEGGPRGRPRIDRTTIVCRPLSRAGVPRPASVAPGEDPVGAPGMVEPPFVCENSPRFATIPRQEESPMATPASATSARNEVRPVVPKLVDLSETVLYGDVWERPGLSKRDRSLVTVAALIALYRGDQLRGHLERALANGVTREEISELITHLAFYSGWPTAMTAARVAKGVFESRP